MTTDDLEQRARAALFDLWQRNDKLDGEVEVRAVMDALLAERRAAVAYRASTAAIVSDLLVERGLLRDALEDIGGLLREALGDIARHGFDHHDVCQTCAEHINRGHTTECPVPRALAALSGEERS